MKETRHKGLHIACVYLCDILEKAKCKDGKQMSSFEGLGVGEGADFKGTAGGGLGRRVGSVQ